MHRPLNPTTSPLTKAPSLPFGPSIPVDATVDNVFPTWTKNTTLVVRLVEGATVADSGSFTVNVTEPDNGYTSTLTVLVSVAPAYHPSLSVDGSPLVHLEAGGSTNVTFTAHNLGTVTDTLLLDVEVQPDLASWWANHTNTSTGNNFRNTSGRRKQFLGQRHRQRYGFKRNQHRLDVRAHDGQQLHGCQQFGNAGRRRHGCRRLQRHPRFTQQRGHETASTLVQREHVWQPVEHHPRGSPWDYVVLQDQSQVPSFPSTNSMWQDSKNASVLLSEAIADEGGETVLFMTWGYRSGDSLNSFNNNFTAMQARLTEGYTRYAENISSAGHAVWMAPVGLAFKTVHDGVVADGDDPTVSGNLFYDLYTSDGSHPSLSGSYLAACVFHATITGETCAGSTDTVNLNSSTKLALQQAADDTVFNQTAGMSYYPWEASGMAAFGLGSSVPQGWYIQWQDDELSNIPAGGSASATLSITVPSDAAPDFYGYYD